MFLPIYLEFAMLSERKFGGRLRAIIVRKLRMLSIRRSPNLVKKYAGHPQKCSIFPQNGHFGRIWTFCHTLWPFWQTNAIWHRCCNYKGVNAKYAYKPRTLRYKHCLTNLGGKNYETCNVS